MPTTTLTTSTHFLRRFIQASLALCAVQIAALTTQAVPLQNGDPLQHWTTNDGTQYGGISTATTPRSPATESELEMGSPSGEGFPSGRVSRSTENTLASAVPASGGSGGGSYTWVPIGPTYIEKPTINYPYVHVPPPAHWAPQNVPDGGATVILLGCGLLVLFLLRRRALI
jgi:hypothetical protein